MMPQVDEFGRPLKQFIPPMIQTAPQQPYQIPEPPMAQQALSIPSPVPQVQSAPQGPAQIPQIQPTAAGPAQTAIESAPVPPLAPPQRGDPQYTNGRLRTVLNAIAGGLAGASGGPKVGMEVGTSLRDSKYNRAMQDYNTNLGLRTQQAASESNRQKIGETAAGLAPKIVTADSLANSRAGNLEVRKGELTVKQDDQKSKQSHREELGKYTEWKMQPGHEKLDDLQYLTSLSEDEAPAALAMLKKINEAKGNTPEAKAANATAVRQANIDTDAANIPKIAAVSGAKGFATASNAAAGRTAEEGSQITTEMQTSYQNLLKNDPTTATATLKMLPPGARLKLLNQAGIPAALPAKEQERLFNSKITLAHVGTARKLATDPMISKNLGALSGRLEIIKGKIGTGDPDTLDYSKAIANLKPTEARKMGEFLNFLNYMVVWESTNLSGTRPAQRLIESLRETGARASMSQDRLLGALDAIDKSVKNTIGAILPNQDAGKKETKKTSSGDSYEVIK
jgi:hypothetical protein